MHLTEQDAQRRARDILAYLNHSAPPAHPSNTYAAPSQDLRNLTHYITRTLLETGGFKS